MNFRNLDPELNYRVQDSTCTYYNFDNMSECFQNSSRSLKVISFNVRSIKNKIDLLLSSLSLVNIDFTIIILTETWLNNENEFPDIPGYTAYHCVRSDRGGGGVTVLVDHSVDSHLVDVYIDELWESVSVAVTSSGNEYYVTGVYRPPRQALHNFNSVFFPYIDRISLDKTSFVVGDFNVDLCCNNMPQPSTDFINEYRSLHYFPLITLPTRVTENTSSCLDHIWSNSLLPHKSGVLVSDISDHYGVFFDIPSSSIKNNELIEIRFRDVSPASVEHLKNELNDLLQNFANNYGFMETEEKTNFFLSIFRGSYNRCCPIRTKKVSLRKLLCPWLTPELQESIKRKQTLFKLSRDNSDFVAEYKNARNRLGTLIRNAKCTYYGDKFDAAVSDCRRTWRIINNIVKPGTKRRDEIMVEVDGDMLCDPVRVSNAFNNYFTNIGASLASEIHHVNVDPLDFVDRKNNSFMFFPTTAEEVKSIIMKFKSKQCELNDIPSFVYKKVAHIIAPVISHLVNESFTHGHFPTCLKHATVIPIHKNGSKSCLNNYRPISTLPFLSKIFERVISVRLLSYCEKYEIIVPHQYGFCSGKSVCDLLVRFGDDVYSSFNERGFLMAVFLDFRRAFDTVNHNILLRKLECYGVRGIALKWFESYLSNRDQAVRVGGCVSSVLPVSIGVPQGSILGPILFNLYINDMYNSYRSLSFMHYADDTTVFLRGRNLDELAATMSQGLSSIDIWLRANVLSLNLAKTKLMIFTNKHIVDEPDIFINGGRLSVVKSVNMLGVVVDDRLSFVEHFNLVASKISRSCAVLRRLSSFLPFFVLKKIYLSLVYPYLVYCVELWGRSSKTMAGRLEKLQARCVKAVGGGDVVDNNVFRQYGLLSFTDVYKYFTLCRMFKYYVLQSDVYFMNYFNSLLPRHSIGTRFHANSNLNTPQILLSKTYCSFKYNAIKYWNGLPEAIRSSVTLAAFKERLRLKLLN